MLNFLTLLHENVFELPFSYYIYPKFNEVKNLTLKDIAQELNLSITTVSKALKDYPDVSKKTKEKVKNYAHKVNFKPNAFAAYGNYFIIGRIL
jgi:DNA-binding transcriptional regulator GbsR (MarR family)